MLLDAFFIFAANWATHNSQPQIKKETQTQTANY